MNTNGIRIVIACFCMVGLVGCVSAQFAPAKVGQSYPSRTPPDKIELFRSQMPTRKYFELGTVTVCCSLATEKTVDLMRVKASENGGDALMGLDISAGGAAMATLIRYE